MPNVVKGSKQERMIVVPHRPGRNRLLALGLLAAAAVSVIGGAYVGYTHGEDLRQREQDELEEAKSQLAAAQEDADGLRRALILAQSESDVDRRAALELESDLMTLQLRVAELETDVQYYRGVVTEQTGSTGLAISRFELSPGASKNARRYKIVLRQQDADGDTYLEGHVAVTLVGRQDGQQRRLALKEVSPQQDEVDIRLRFKYFQNIEGEIEVPNGFEPAKIEVSAVADTPVAKRVDQEFVWDS